MSCASPVVAVNPLTGRTVVRPCHHCTQCRIALRSPWELRLRNELRRHSYVGSFVTMTYSDDKYDVRKGLDYSHVEAFWHKLRRKGYRFSYYCVGEYGSDTARPHWHALVYGIDPSCRKDMFDCWQWCFFPRFTATSITSSRIRYTLKYMDKETCSFSDWSNEFPDKARFLYHVDSGRLSFQREGVKRPKAYMSKNLGSDDFCEDLSTMFYDGLIHYGMSSYPAPHHYTECISNWDVVFQKNRECFSERLGIEKERSRFFWKTISQFEMHSV